MNRLPPIVRTERYQRGVFGWIFKILFIAFNVFMLAAVGLTLASISGVHVENTNEAARTGMVLGITAGIGVILFLWALGSVILGLLTYFTRGPKIIVEETRSPTTWRKPVGIALAILLGIGTLSVLSRWPNTRDITPAPSVRTENERGSEITSLTAQPTTAPASDVIKQKGQPETKTPATAPSTPSSEPISKGDWQVTEEKSKIDDSKNVFLNLASLESIRNQYGQVARLELWISCREKKTDLYFTFGGHFMSSVNGAGALTYRVDKKAAQKKEFTESNNHQALGLWSGPTSIPFIKEMFGGSTLFVRAVPYNESAVTGDFNISGIEDAIKPLREACRWPDFGTPPRSGSPAPKDRPGPAPTQAPTRLN